jgi:hypothetical protein
MLSHKRDIAEHTHAVALYSSVPGLPCGPASDLNVYVYTCAKGCIHGFSMTVLMQSNPLEVDLPPAPSAACA